MLSIANTVAHIQSLLSKKSTKAELEAALKAATEQLQQQSSRVGGKKNRASVIAKDRFLEHAKALPVTIDGQQLSATVKAFSTGSFGWNLTGKLTVMVDGHPVELQVGGNFTVLGSKPAANGVNLSTGVNVA
jgi:hypothetical protein